MPCVHCGGEFLYTRSKKTIRKFCSRVCSGAYVRGIKRPRTLVEKNCKWCGVGYLVRARRAKCSVYRSRSCVIAARLDRPRKKRAPREDPRNKSCHVCGTGGLARKAKYCSPDCRYLGRYKKPRSELSTLVRGCGICGTPIRVWTKRPQKNCIKCASGLRAGAQNPNWKGGVTNENQQIRRSPEGVAWRKAVFGRDCFTCQICGQVGGTLHADHIKPFAYYPDLRTELSNGRTLCKECHEKTDTYLCGAKKHAKRLA